MSAKTKCSLCPLILPYPYPYRFSIMYSHILLFSLNIIFYTMTNLGENTAKCLRLPLLGELQFHVTGEIQVIQIQLCKVCYLCLHA